MQTHLHTNWLGAGAAPARTRPERAAAKGEAAAKAASKRGSQQKGTDLFTGAKTGPSKKGTDLFTEKINLSPFLLFWNVMAHRPHT